MSIKSANVLHDWRLNLIEYNFYNFFFQSKKAVWGKIKVISNLCRVLEHFGVLSDEPDAETGPVYLRWALWVRERRGPKYRTLGAVQGGGVHARADLQVLAVGVERQSRKTGTVDQAAASETRSVRQTGWKKNENFL